MERRADRHDDTDHDAARTSRINTLTDEVQAQVLAAFGLTVATRFKVH